jgi:hypothetical protein
METTEGHQKSIFNTSKVKKNKDTYGIYLRKFASSTQKHKKIIETPNQPIEIKKISNKSMFKYSKNSQCTMNLYESSLCIVRVFTVP